MTQKLWTIFQALLASSILSCSNNPAATPLDYEIGDSQISLPEKLRDCAPSTEHSEAFRVTLTSLKTEELSCAKGSAKDYTIILSFTPDRYLIVGENLSVTDPFHVEPVDVSTLSASPMELRFLSLMPGGKAQPASNSMPTAWWSCDQDLCASLFTVDDMLVFLTWDNGLDKPDPLTASRQTQRIIESWRSKNV